MTVHLINRQTLLPSTVKLLNEGDTVIITNDQVTFEAISTFASRSVTVALLEGVEGATTLSEDIHAAMTLKIISDDDWVRYTTSSEPVISWG